MTIGQVLLQPQKIRRGAAPTSSDALVDDFLSLVTRVMVDRMQGGSILDVFQEGLDAAADRLVQQTSATIDAARDRLRDWAERFIVQITSVAESLAEADDLASALEAADQIVTLLRDVAENLTADQLRDNLGEALDIVQNDLGLTGDFMAQQIWALVDDVVARLQTPPQPTDATLRQNRRAVAALLRRIKGRLQDQFSFPELNADQMASEIIRWLRRTGFDASVNKVACVGSGVGDVITLATTLASLVPSTSAIFGPNSLGAAEAAAREQFAWYATWLLGDKFRPWYVFFLPKDEVWVSADKTSIIRKNVWRDDETLATGTNLDWTKVPVFNPANTPHFTFGLVDQNAMEQVARHSAWISDYLEIILHLLALRRGDIVSNILNSVSLGAHGTYRLITSTPDFPIHPVLRWLIGRTAMTFGASFEGIHTNATFGNAFKFWLLLLASDAIEAFSQKSRVDTLRDLTLSVLTLLNYQGQGTPPPAGTPDTRAENRVQVDTIVDLVGLLASWLLAISIPRRDYAHPFQGPGDHAVQMWLLYGLLAALGLGILAGFIGTAIGQAVARAVDWGVLGKQIGRSAVRTWLLFWLTLYSFKEGDTDDGKYNPRGAAFNGYPAVASSPYRLPYESGKSVFCAQGNQGMWSHNNFAGTAQVYAYDLGLDQGEEILAARHGTVVDFFDWVPDDQNVMTPAPPGATIAGQTTAENWNFICIRHDLVEDASGNLVAAGPDTTHDLGPGGAVSTTYAEYGHGRQNSVRQVFANRLGIPIGSITANNIIGQQIRQGTPIMLSGNTGNSFINHVHIHVRTGPNSTTPPPVSRANLGNFTLPFVFRDVTPFIGKDGVPESLNFYTSENARVP